MLLRMRMPVKVGIRSPVAIVLWRRLLLRVTVVVRHSPVKGARLLRLVVPVTIVVRLLMRSLPVRLLFMRPLAVVGLLLVRPLPVGHPLVRSLPVGLLLVRPLHVELLLVRSLPVRRRRSRGAAAAEGVVGGAHRADVGVTADELGAPVGVRRPRRVGGITAAPAPVPVAARVASSLQSRGDDVREKVHRREIGEEREKRT